MKHTALVSLDCEHGRVNRWLRIEGNKPKQTGRVEFPDWDRTLQGVGLAEFWEWMQGFRTGFVPPEEDGPRPTPPLRNAARMAA